MADGRRFIPNQQLDLGQILQEAQHRWLRPTEICEILRNYQKFHLTPDPPVRPPAGSLFLFDRKALRYFRKDGHSWRKKKDGKTVKEAHEKLKAGSVDVLHCYYAHGEDNENFQRRSYWMLDGQLEHIVLVHYREVKEGYKSGLSRLLNADTGSQVGSPLTSSAPCSAYATSPASTAQIPYSSSPNTVEWNGGQALSSEFEDADSLDDPGTSSLAQPIYGSLSHSTSLHTHEASGIAPANFKHGTRSPLWAETQSSRNVNMHDKTFYFGQPNGAEFITHKLTDARMDAGNTVQDIVTSENRLDQDVNIQSVTATSQRAAQVKQKGIQGIGAKNVTSFSQAPRRPKKETEYSLHLRKSPESFFWSLEPNGPHESMKVKEEHDFHFLHPQVEDISGCHSISPLNSTTQVESSWQRRPATAITDESGELKKLDSFGRWMDKEIGGDCDDSLMVPDSGNYWNTLDTQNDKKEVPGLSREMQLEIGSLSPSLSQQQLFSISDFSPDWAYSGIETKVLITGTFLGDANHCSNIKWSCMFGEIEVSAEVLTGNVIRCQAPPLHAPGRVPLYVTCSNRLACSEVREFQYREAFSTAPNSAVEDELRLQIRLGKILWSGLERKWLSCCVEECMNCKIKNDLYSIMRSENQNDWRKIEEALLSFEGNRLNPRDMLIQNLLKDRLYEWLVCKVHQEGKGPHVLEGGLGAIHLAAALGYDWAMGPIVAAGVSPSFRDAKGRTALHWAAYYGREETVIALVRLGAAPGAVDDPTPAFPGGQTAADLASSRGHKGIAGYLAEADLTTHLTSLTVNENVMDSVTATFKAENALQIAQQSAIPSDGIVAVDKEKISLKGSLAAVRKSAHAAALIQSAIQSRSLSHREQLVTKTSNDTSEVSADLAALGYLNRVQKTSNFKDYLHSAAEKIQQKYRGWKGRRDFLRIRKRVVKIQAHVRGHQVRKQYKKVVWSVSIVEKAILRWRRKGPGLRGFQVPKAVGNVVPDFEKTDEYDFLRIAGRQKYAGVEKALARVHSMVRHPEARDQYMRLVTKFENFKIGNKGTSSSQQVESSERSTKEDGLHEVVPDL